MFRPGMMVAALALAVALAAVPEVRAAEPAKQDEKKTEAVKWAPAVEPKPLSDNVLRGLAFLVQHQRESGGWAQGEESARMGKGMDKTRDKPNVADTCAATLALIRAGSTAKSGPQAKNIRKGIDFICSQVEKADESSMRVTDVRGTRLQQKLGQYIDTFLAALVLSEAKGKMGDEPSEKRVFAALDKVMNKIETNQRSDGTWADDGWAPTLAQGMGTKALNRSVMAGRAGSEDVRAKAEGYARKQFNKAAGDFAKRGSAGVQLYAGAASLGGQQESANANAALRQKYTIQYRNGRTVAVREKAKRILDRFDAAADDLKATQEAIVKKVEDPNFIKGFGSNGGEEFLSYMNIGESLVVKGGEEWQKWDKSMTANLNRIQNEDGSWSGHHCITGRTFCTAASLLVLTTDRAPVPVSAKFKKRR